MLYVAWERGGKEGEGMEEGGDNVFGGGANRRCYCCRSGDDIFFLFLRPLITRRSVVYRGFGACIFWYLLGRYSMT